MSPSTGTEVGQAGEGILEGTMNRRRDFERHFKPIRSGHGCNPGPYIVDQQGHTAFFAVPERMGKGGSCLSPRLRGAVGPRRQYLETIPGLGNVFQLLREVIRRL